HNWWCVMFPPMCVSAAGEIETDDEKITDCLTESGEKAVSNGTKYVVRFKLLEIFEELKSKV
ncbi:MAG: stage II sporulation protein R, partial [Oscillospiraceae bacterium]|nr:stage II sporulation protein R [Oscillospiraceae bacterium]